MSIPALRKPKLSKPVQGKSKKAVGIEQELIILTLKNSLKLVVSSDSFHSIITMGDKYKCVLCNIDMVLESKKKEYHKNLPDHQKLLKIYPHLEELAENLIRQIDNNNCYCTICNVITSTNFLMRHIKTEEHVNELSKAKLRADTYKPYDINHNK